MEGDWDDIVAMTRIADDAGLEFILPVAKWRGYPGRANIYGRSFEDPDPRRRAGCGDEADRHFLHRACAAGDARVRRQGDRDHRPCGRMAERG